MTGKSRDPGRPRSENRQDRPAGEPETRPTPPMPPAGPHAEAHLTNPDATPGTGSLTKTDHADVETDPGGG
jgi:hypothetical protein